MEFRIPTWEFQTHWPETLRTAKDVETMLSGISVNWSIAWSPGDHYSMLEPLGIPGRHAKYNQMQHVSWCNAEKVGHIRGNVTFLPRIEPWQWTHTHTHTQTDTDADPQEERRRMQLATVCKVDCLVESLWNILNDVPQALKLWWCRFCASSFAWASLNTLNGLFHIFYILSRFIAMAAERNRWWRRTWGGRESYEKTQRPTFKRFDTRQHARITVHLCHPMSWYPSLQERSLDMTVMDEDGRRGYWNLTEPHWAGEVCQYDTSRVELAYFISFRAKISVVHMNCVGTTLQTVHRCGFMWWWSPIFNQRCWRVWRIVSKATSGRKNASAATTWLSQGLYDYTFR